MLTILPVLCHNLFTNMNPGCTNLDEYNSRFDSLSPPPPPSSLINLPNDTIITNDYVYPHDINFIWHKVSGPEHYELQVPTSTGFLGVTNTIANDTVWVYELISSGHRYWRVKAFAQAWELYTDWINVWHFVTWYIP